MTWGYVGAAAVSVVGGAIESKQNAKSARSSSGTSGFCACIQSGTSQAVSSAKQIANQPFTAFCACVAVAGLTPNQIAAGGAANYGSQYLPAFQDTAAQKFNPQTIQQYSSPYVNQVVNAQDALATRDYQSQLSQLQTREGMTGAFGGDRSAIAESQLSQNYNLNKQLMDAKALNESYSQGVSAFNQDRGFAAGQVAQGENALSATGGVAQQTNQNRGNFMYNQFCQQRNWAKNQNSYLTQTLAQLPKGQYYSGNQTSQTIPAGGGWGGALAGAGAILTAGNKAGVFNGSSCTAGANSPTGNAEPAFNQACTAAEVAATTPQNVNIGGFNQEPQLVE